jgi:hypothetical protein
VRKGGFGANGLAAAVNDPRANEQRARRPRKRSRQAKRSRVPTAVWEGDGKGKKGKKRQGKARKGKERKVEVSVARYLRTPPKGANPQDLI